VIVNTLIEIDPHFPTISAEAERQLIDVRKLLESEDPAEVRTDGDGSRGATKHIAAHG
jgi:hypothetical protein